METTEQLHINTNVDQQDKGDYTYKVEHVVGTPFSIIEKEGDYFGALGNHRITDIYEDKKELEKNLKKTDWDKIVQVIYAVVEQFNNKNKIE
jgi:hypothetical protein